VTSTITRLEKTAKSGDKKAVAALPILKAVAQSLDQGQPARRMLTGLSPEAAEVVKPLNLLTAKPVLYVANIHERELAAGETSQVAAVRTIAEAEGAKVVVICGAIEAQLAALSSDEERAEYMDAVGVKEPGLHQMIRSGYALLDLITYFTVGPKEDRAWTVRRGATAPQAAGEALSGPRSSGTTIFSPAGARRLPANGASGAWKGKSTSCGTAI
jgi:ribosome-binding ATPase YchF (GTP1/OBG family)